MGPKRPTLEPNCYAFLVDQDFFGRFSFNSPVISNPPPRKKTVYYPMACNFVGYLPTN